jgi:hypothetical protein
LEGLPDDRLVNDFGDLGVKYEFYSPSIGLLPHKVGFLKVFEEDTLIVFV